MTFDDCEYVTVPPSIIEHLEEIAEQWLEGDEDDRDFETENYEEANFIGLYGEWAFSAFYGLDFNPTIGEGDEGYDYKMVHKPSGSTGTVDVRCITFTNGDLLMRSWRDVTADLYFLTEKRDNDVGFVGCATKDMMEEADIYPPGMYSPVEVRRVPREKLIAPMHPRDMERA